jgi:hypothetical protein
MMGATLAYLAEIRGSQRLGSPGVRLGSVPLYNPGGVMVATQSVVLPETVLGVKSVAEPITDVEITGLPRDTTFGRRRYPFGNGFDPLITTVLMGTDRTSIHDPHFCLPGAGWTIDSTEHFTLRIGQPYPYDLPAIKVTCSKLVANEYNQAVMIRGFYVYWFVTADKITADQGLRLWSIAKTMVEKRELERWAYISYFVPCLSEDETPTFNRLKKFIQASVPAFQAVAGPPAGESAPVAALE